MSSLRILVSYDGEWIKSPESGVFKFNGSKGKGMLVPKNIRYQELLEKVCRLLLVDPNEFSLCMTVMYASRIPVPPAEIVNDEDVNFFISENSSDVSLRTPLCVTLVRRSSPLKQPAHEKKESNGNSHIAPKRQVQAFVPESNPDRIEENLPVFSVDNEFQDDNSGTSSPELASEEAPLEPQLNSNSDQPRAQRSLVEWVTTREDLAAMKKEAVAASRKQDIEVRTEEPLSPSSVNHSWELGTRHMFPSKKELQQKISLLAIRENFEFRVKRSTKKRLHVQCVEQGCAWQLRASAVGISASFQIRKFVKDHSCSKEARGQVHRQASSWIIRQHIKSKCRGVNEEYKPREIMEDIRKELGLNVSYERAWRAREMALYSDGETPRPRPNGSRPGRPKKPRIESIEDVNRKRNNCGLCGNCGHNRKTCPVRAELLRKVTCGGDQDRAPSTMELLENSQ